MTYFSDVDHKALLQLQAVKDSSGEGLQRIHKRMTDLHRRLLPIMRKAGLELHPIPNVPGNVTQHTTTTPFATDAMSIIYMRSTAEATAAEGIMGRDGLTTSGSIEPHRHPVIELRLTPDHFVVEFVISPDAWCDQRNFVGKMTVEEHRARFCQILNSIGDDYCLGFWSGPHLSDLHLSTSQLPPSQILCEYMDTFAAGRDWLRIGHWYEPGDPALDEDTILDELVNRIRALHNLYTFTLWTSNNNFHPFYAKAVSR